jgi:para-nitrobenzyl esterase
MSRRSSGHVTFNAMNWTWARQQVATGKSKVFFYHFGRIPPLPPDCTFFENEASRLGAFHTAEILYVFDTLDKRPWPWREIDRALARMLSSYWVNFATHGDPNGTGVPLWPTFDPDGPTVLLVENAITAGVLPERKELDLWNVCLQHLRERRGR